MARMWLAVVLFAIAPIALPAHQRGQQQTAETTPFDTLYRSYADGQYDAVAKEINTIADLNALNPPKPADLRKWLGAWDRSKSAYLLELALAAGPISRTAQAAFLSEGRLYVITRTALVGTSPPDDEFEVLWHKAAMGLLEEVMFFSAESVYLDTVQRRYTSRPGGPTLTLDPRFVFERAVATEQYCWRAPEGIGGPPMIDASDPSLRVAGGQPVEMYPNPTGTEGRPLTRKECLAEAAKQFAAAAAVTPDIAAESLTRAAWLKAQLGAYKDALELNDRSGATDDNVVAYWQQLFRGRILTGLGRDADAERAYRAALTAHASAHSANIGLALTLFKLKRLNEARALAASIRQAPPDVVDPWWTYLGADARFVTKWVEEVREKIRPQLPSYTQ
jgi:tetratricopeptide (TPR) repeat protein